MAIPLLFLLLSISLAPSHAATDCASYKFSNNKTFDKCSTLAHLSASLHWTYNSDGTLSIGFIAPPAAPSGWVAWGINPTATGMIGTQALIAFKQSNGSMAVNTYNITSYKSIQQSPILYEPSNLSSEFGSDGNIVLFATLKIGKSVESLNQVYQVGSSVTNGVPDEHAFNTDNLNSKAELVLSGTNFASKEPAPAPSNGRSEAAAPGASSGGNASSPAAGANAAWRSSVSGLWSIFLVLLVGCMVRF
ncbi:Cytochrome b561 and DOMON domain-containing protein [Rhynchospora pubera]|uniref:Cytochrome b561 and DOMON domain-containing protein n=1 Tax=Rhynchospora pubera TaxID=906938 RepID=A0AAV8GI10_9POAL|nr:Cytochrome b561 and DOMON domain-containing protein [Rhynchospora pubera]